MGIGSSLTNVMVWAVSAWSHGWHGMDWGQTAMHSWGCWLHAWCSLLAESRFAQMGVSFKQSTKLYQDVF